MGRMMACWKTLVVVAVLACSGAAVLAEEAPMAPIPLGGGGFMIPSGGSNSFVIGGMGADPNDPTQYIKQLDPIVTLTDDQKQQITTIYSDRAKELADFKAELEKKADKVRAIEKAITDASKAQDQAAMSKAMQDYQALYAPQNAIYQKSAEKLDKVLTPQQKARQADAQVTATIQMMAAPAKLTENQIKAVKAAGTGEDSMTDYAAMSKALEEVLTPQQKATNMKYRGTTLAKMKFYAAKLTPEQTQQIDAAADAIVKDSDLTQNEVVEKISEKIEALLTPEQKKAVHGK